jgi:hypothetical protein
VTVHVDMRRATCPAGGAIDHRRRVLDVRLPLWLSGRMQVPGVALGAGLVAGAVVRAPDRPGPMSTVLLASALGRVPSVVRR